MAGPLTLEGSGGVEPPSLLTPLAGPGEVETEFEDDREEDEEEEGQEPPEVEEELGEEGYDSGYDEVTPSAASQDTGETYAVPEVNTEVWKKFGCDTEAGRALRKLYAPLGTAGAAGASKVSYPRLKSPAERWQPKPKAKGACPQRAPVRVPAPVRFKPLDRDDPKNWRIPVPCRKPGEQILAEMAAEVPQAMPHVPGRNQAKEKRDLADRFQFCGGRMMPKGAMGHAEHSEDLPKLEGPNMRERSEARNAVDDNGMNAEHREIFQELMLAVQRKQDRIKEIDALNAAEKLASKAKTNRNKEALELRNDIDRCLKDIDRLMELTDA